MEICVLRYLQNETKAFLTFGANRGHQIKDISNVAQWKYVPFAENVDDTSRGMPFADFL